MIDKVKIETVASAIFSKHYKIGIPSKIILKIIAKEGIKLREIDGDKNFLGAFHKTRKKAPYIFINRKIENIGRKNFTIAHELGHFVLEHHLQKASFLCGENEIEEKGKVSWQEKEANYFASCFLLPKDKVKKEFTDWFRGWFGYGRKLCLEVQPTNGESYRNWKIIRKKLIDKYVVSEAALKIRLVELGLVNNF